MLDLEEPAVPALLERLARLDRQQALALVRPPLPRAAVAGALTQQGLAAPPPLRAWFSAWDGQDPTAPLGVIDVLPGFYALSVEESLAHRAAHASTWPASWLPLLADGGGDFYLVDTTDRAAPVLRYRFDEIEPQAVAVSLARFVEVALRAYDGGVIFVDGDYLDQNEDAWWHLLGLDDEVEPR